MIDLGPHALYIVFAYLGVFAVTLALVFGVALNAHTKRRRLAKMEAARKPEAGA